MLKLETASPFPHVIPGDPEPAPNALDQLQAWIEANPSERGVWEMVKIGGRWRVGLSGPCGERFTASQDARLEGAIRNALMIAAMAGYE